MPASAALASPMITQRVHVLLMALILLCGSKGKEGHHARAHDRLTVARSRGAGAALGVGLAAGWRRRGGGLARAAPARLKPGLAGRQGRPGAYFAS